MKNIFSRTAAAFAALSLMLAASACGSKDSSSESGEEHEMLVSDDLDENVSIAAEDMPEEASYIQLRPEIDGVPIMIETFGGISVEEAKKISQYIAAIGSVDESLLNESVYKPFLDMKISSSDSYDSYSSYLQVIHDFYQTNYIGSEYTFDYVSVESYFDSSSFDFSAMDEQVLSADPNAEISDRKVAQLQVLYDGLSKSLQYRMNGNLLNVYVYTINGVPYVIG